MKKLLHLSLFTFLIIISVMNVRVNAQQTDPAELYAGAASYDITPPIGTPLGGTGGFPRRWKYLFDWFGQHPYANLFTPSVGVHDALHSKALVLKNHNSMILFLSLDLVGVTVELYDKLKADLTKLGFDEVIISATHTHSASGALSKSWVWEYLAMDKFNQTVYDLFMAGVMKSIELAYEQLEPASLYAGSFDLAEIHHNRRGHEGHMDNRANLLIARALGSNRPIGGIVNYAIHGMAMGGDGLLFSADVSGGIERHMEQLLVGDNNYKKPTMLFVNGTEGDVTTVYGGSDGIEKAGTIFAEHAAPVIPQMRKIDSNWSIRSMVVPMPKGRVDMTPCNVVIGGAKLKLKIYLPKKPIPRFATIWQLQMGDIKIMTFPGEPTTYVGDAAKALAQAQGDKDVWIFGLTNGHMGYFVTPDEYIEGGIESCTALHGPQASVTLLSAHDDLLKARSSVSGLK